jgi:outer membrane murein-binding lipoprotein Lpp
MDMNRLYQAMHTLASGVRELREQVASISQRTDSSSPLSTTSGLEILESKMDQLSKKIDNLEMDFKTFGKRLEDELTQTLTQTLNARCSALEASVEEVKAEVGAKCGRDETISMINSILPAIQQSLLSSVVESEPVQPTTTVTPEPEPVPVSLPDPVIIERSGKKKAMNLN